MIKRGNSNLRNPILASFAAKNILPYRGLGSGIRRALEEWPRIEFIDDREGSLFTAVVRRDPSVQGIEERTPEVERFLLAFSGTHTRNELQGFLALKDAENFRKTSLLPALNAGLIEMTIPDKPRSSKQQYRLTEQGRRGVGGLRKER